jgi:hypothetical protein
LVIYVDSVEEFGLLSGAVRSGFPPQSEQIDESTGQVERFGQATKRHKKHRKAFVLYVPFRGRTAHLANTFGIVRWRTHKQCVILAFGRGYYETS